jgi:hypothetical protein
MNYQFSAEVVYNNYPWPQAATAKQRQAIEEAAQGESLHFLGFSADC